jgi:hypothetical protein
LFIIQRQEVQPEFCAPPDEARPAASCGISRPELYVNTAESEKVMFGLATSRCRLGGTELQPHKQVRAEAITAAGPSRRSFNGRD